MVWVIVLVVIVVLLVIFSILAYNGLIQLKNRVDAAWAQIEVQLKRRADQIPNLIETVKGYAAHEKSTFDMVVQARSASVAASGPAQQAAAENQLTGALRQLFALSEAYPDLKADSSFLALQEEITATEGRIAYARQAYNDDVKSLNTKREQFPSMIFARMMGLQPREYFEAEPEARVVPKVQF